jgi:16S rRNA (cytosine967-C5)-methyltransferase
LQQKKQPAALIRALNIGCHQLFALDTIPVHAACSTTVELLHHHGAGKLAGVANAIMRRLADMRLSERVCAGPLGRLPDAIIPADPAISASLPDALVSELRKHDILLTTQQFLQLNTVAPLCTRTRPGFSPLSGQSILKQQGDWTWWDDPSEAINGVVAARRAVVQDMAQGHVIEMSGARAGNLVIDLCAAPGGKSLAFMDRGCQVISCDSAREKMVRLRDNCGADAALVVANGLHAPFAPHCADIVLCDVPCSNSGVFARRPEAKQRYEAKHLKKLHDLQRGLLKKAAQLVKKDGKLIYSTCSISPTENQAIAHNLAGWRLLSEHTAWPDAWQGGGYVAVLVRS